MAGSAGGRSSRPRSTCDGSVPRGPTLEPDYGKAPLNVSVTQADFRWATLMMRHPRGLLRVLRIGLRWLAAMVTRKRTRGTRPGARRCDARGPARTPASACCSNTPLDDLVVDEGRVTGVVLADGRVLHARHGVVLACGGFEHNETMRKQYQREPIGTQWSVGAAANTGDGILAGERAGAALDLMADAWWGPSVPLTGGPWFCLAERTLPGGIMVNARGERFMNEALPYVEAVHAMYGGEYGQGDGPGENIPCWMVIDQRYRNRYVFAGRAAAAAVPRALVQGRRRRARGHRRGTRRRRSASTRRAARDGRAVQRLRPRPGTTTTSAAATAATTATTAIRRSSRTRACS